MPDTVMTAQLPERRFAEDHLPEPASATDDVKQLKYWSVYRSGATLSVSGIDAETLRSIVITGVTSLGPDLSQRVLISDGRNQRWELVL